MPSRSVTSCRGAGRRDGWCRCVPGRDGRRDAFLLPRGPFLIPTSAGPERHLLDLASPDRARFSGAPGLPVRQLTAQSVRPGFSCGSPLGGRGDGACPAPTTTPHLPTDPPSPRPAARRGHGHFCQCGRRGCRDSGAGRSCWLLCVLCHSVRTGTGCVVLLNSRTWQLCPLGRRVVSAQGGRRDATPSPPQPLALLACRPGDPGDLSPGEGVTGLGRRPAGRCLSPGPAHCTLGVAFPPSI